MASGYSPTDAETSYNKANTWLKRDANVLVDTRVSSGFLSLSEGTEITKEEAYARIRNAGGNPDAILARMPGTPQYTELPPEPATPAAVTEVNDSAAKESSKGQTAEQKVVNDTPPSTVGAGQGNNDSSPSPTPVAAPLNTNEVQKLETNQTQAENANSGVSQTFPLQSSEKSVEEQKKGIFSNPVYGTAGLGNNPTTSGNSSSVDKTIPANKLYNKLHDFTGYTYRITLFLLSPADLVALSDSPKNFKPTWSLISSGGGFASTGNKDNTNRHPDFMEDFYFDNLEIDTVVGLNAKSKASNAIDVKFNIIEPYGMTLLDRLFSACYTSTNCPNYVDNPYLLQIDFLANVDEANKNNIKGNIIDSKRIPIRITELKIKPGSSGTTYAVRAIPFNHVGFLQSASSTPVNLSVSAKTVGEYFSNDPRFAAQFDESAAKQLRERETLVANFAKMDGATEEAVNTYRTNLQAQLEYNTKSYVAGYNTYYYNIAYKSKLYDYPPYQIVFNIAEEIANSPIIDPTKLSSDKVSMANRVDNLNTTSAAGAKDATFKAESTTNILAGTSIINVIDRVMAASDYIKNQIQEAKKQDEQNTQQETTSTDDSARSVPDAAQKWRNWSNQQQQKKETIDYSPTRWYKVIPSIVLGEYDKKAKAYSKQIVYSIVPYSTANSYHPGFKFTKVSSKECVRTYNYLYTGLNQDIVQMDIDFDATFITGITTYAKQAARGGNDNNSDSQVVDNVQTSDTRKEPKWIPFMTRPTPVDTQMAGQKASRNEKDIQVASVSRSLYSSYPRGDMLNIKVRIVGDPDFIKQDDVYANPLQSDYKEFVAPSTTKDGVITPINSNGQIIFDSSQVYVQLIVKGAIDIDDTTGIVNKKLKLSSGEVTSGSFSGVYKVMRVDNIFTRGKFEQILDLIRMPDDLVESEINATNTSSTSGQTASIEKTAENNQLGPTTGTPFTNPRPDNVPAVDTTLKSIGAGSPINPSNTIAGGGTPSISAQPTNASASNVNDAGNYGLMPQQNAETPSAGEAAANAKAADLSVQVDTLRANYDNYYKEWATRYNPLKNASAEEKNTAENIRARIDLLKEITEKQRDIAVTELRPILLQEMAIRPTTDQVVNLATKISTNAEYIANDRKAALSVIDKLSQQLERLSQ